MWTDILVHWVQGKHKVEQQTVFVSVSDRKSVILYFCSLLTLSYFLYW